MAQRIIKKAQPGMVLTDGTNYACILYLAEGDDGSGWYSISQEAYEARIAAPEADKADYQGQQKPLLKDEALLYGVEDDR